jgi:hypothetical protein
MTQPDLDFTIKVNQARHDKAFQFFLARSFGLRCLVREGTCGLIVRQWRGITYVIEEMRNLPPALPHIKPFPLDF